MTKETELIEKREELEQIIKELIIKKQEDFESITSIKNKVTQEIYIKYLERVIKILLETQEKLNTIKLEKC